jgi:hypothetical protein
MTAAALAAAMSLDASPAAAQKKQPAARATARCRVDSTAAWYARQRAWLDAAERRGWSDTTFRAALLRAAGLDAAGAPPVQLGFDVAGIDAPPATGVVDTVLVARLDSLAATRSARWPTSAVVGAAGTRAVWLLARRDSALARVALHRMMEAGPEESNAADVAVLEDRQRVANGRKQIYGTQFTVAGGRVTLAPMEDSAHVDLRREGAGLPPFRLSACLARQAVAARGS